MNFFTRSRKNPILKPFPNHKWESFKVYNCGAIYENNKYHLFYRAVGKGNSWHSSIGYAVSDNGEVFTRFKKPLLYPKKPFEKLGVEDPRITKVDNTFFMTYTAYDGDCARLGLATSSNLKSWIRHGVMLKKWNLIDAGGFVVEWDEARKNSKIAPELSKAGVIFPEVIGGKYWMLFGDSNIWLATSNNGLTWRAGPKPFLRPRKGNHFDSVHVEMGPSPIKTEKGWLVLYHGIDKKIYYRIGFLLLDLNNPSKILYRSDNPIFEPEESYELKGIVDILPGGLKALQKMNKAKLKKFLEAADKTGRMPKVTFCCGATLVGDALRIYYGASDTFICTATASLKNILDR